MRRFACLLLLARCCLHDGPGRAAAQDRRVLPGMVGRDRSPGRLRDYAAAQWAKDHPDDPMKVIGYADPTGSAQRQRLHVAHARAGGGGPARHRRRGPRDRIVLGAQGATDFTLTSQESRRVEIAIGGP